jgi:hypothetical protein
MQIEKTNEGESFRILPYALFNEETHEIVLDLFIKGKLAEYSEPVHSLRTGRSLNLKEISVEDQCIVLVPKEGEKVVLVPLTLDLFNQYMQENVTEVGRELTSDEEVQEFYENFFSQMRF